eukprot:Pgem_evm1s1735
MNQVADSSKTKTEGSDVASLLVDDLPDFGDSDDDAQAEQPIATKVANGDKKGTADTKGTARKNKTKSGDEDLPAAKRVCTTTDKKGMKEEPKDSKAVAASVNSKTTSATTTTTSSTTTVKTEPNTTTTNIKTEPTASIEVKQE